MTQIKLHPRGVMSFSMQPLSGAKIVFPREWSMVRRKQNPPEWPAGGLRCLKICAADLLDGLTFHCAADIDEVIPDHTEPDPALHSSISSVPAPVEPVPPLDHANTSLAPGPPLLAVAEPAFLLLAFAFRTLRVAIWNADAFDALLFRCGFVLDGIECGVCRHQARCAPKPCLVRFDGRDQQIRIIGSPIVDFVVDHNMVFGFL